jgi:positive phototaxis protein PixI
MKRKVREQGFPNWAGDPTRQVEHLFKTNAPSRPLIFVKPMTDHTNLARLEQLLPQLFEPVAVAGDPYLRFQLTPEIPALLSMERVLEALLVPAHSISPLPNLPALMIGMMNSRQRVFCVVDLAQLLGVAAPLSNLREYQVIVMNFTDSTSGTTNAPSQGKLLGLAVNRVRGIARLAAEQWQPVTGEVPEMLTPYLNGCIFEGDERILGIDTRSILASPLLSVNSAIKSTL